MTEPDTLEEVVELLAWLNEHVHDIPPHRRAHALVTLERVERMAIGESVDAY